MNDVGILRLLLLRAMYLLIAVGLAMTVWPDIVVPHSLVAGPALDKYASETLFAVLMGVVLVPIVVPWGYVIDHYVLAPGERWRNGPHPQTPQGAV